MTNGTHYIEPTGKKVYKAIVTQSGSNTRQTALVTN